MRNWLSNDSAEQVDFIIDSENFVVGGSDPKSNPSVATHTTSIISATDTANGILTRKIIHCSSTHPSKLSKQGLEQVAEAQVL